MNSDVHAMFRITSIAWVLSIFPTTAIFASIAIISATAMARENAAGSREQRCYAISRRMYFIIILSFRDFLRGLFLR